MRRRVDTEVRRAAAEEDEEEEVEEETAAGACETAEGGEGRADGM